MEQGIYIFKDTNSFLKQMRILTKEYNKPKPKILYLNKYIDSCKSVRKELNFIKKCYINSFDSFYNSQVVRITITDYTGCTINIRYTFKGESGYLFREFRKYIKRNKENIYI